MTIRKIITSAAFAAILGLAGGSASADDSHIDEGFQAASDANYPGTVFAYNGDSDVNEGTADTFGIEMVVLPEHLWCTKWASSGQCWVKPSS